jgi:hypothetical protein
MWRRASAKGGIMTTQRKLAKKTIDMCADQCPMIGDSIRSYYNEQGIEEENDNILNIDVSFDGSWMTRGHKSHIGLGFVMEADTGFCVDHEVLSNFCQKCSRINKNYADDEDMRAHAIDEHKDTGECLKNYTGNWDNGKGMRVADVASVVRRECTSVHNIHQRWRFFCIQRYMRRGHIS